jgi:hypothetical protein
MSRNGAALGALVLVGGLLWLVTAWPTADDDRAEPSEPDPEPPPAAAPAAPEPAAQLAPPVIGTPVKAPEPAPPPPPEPAPAPPPENKIQPRVPSEDMFAKDQGPVAEYKALYDKEPRDSAAHQYENRISGSFWPGDGAPDLFKSVICRTTICKIELRWKPDRIGPYVAGLTRAAVHFKDQVAVASAAPVADDKERVIDVYIKRKPITDTEVPPMLQPPDKDKDPSAAAQPQPGAAEPPAQNAQSEK